MSRRQATAVFVGVTVYGSLAAATSPLHSFCGDCDAFVVPTFDLAGPGLGSEAKPVAAPAHLAGSTIAALDDGALVIDADSGQLVRVDRAGKPTSRLDVAAGAAQLVYDPAAERAYVADRANDHIAVVAVGETLELIERWETPAEPWGLALAPDRATLLVTTIADRTLVAFDVARGRAAWQEALSLEPRGVSIAPDGASALVTYLTTGTVERIELGDGRQRRQVPLPAGPTRVGGFTSVVAASDPGRGFARNAFAVRHLGNGVAVVGFQESIPAQVNAGVENTGAYGGGSDAPVRHHLAFVGAPGPVEIPTVKARLILHQPNALAWNGASDRLAVAGFGSDDLLLLSGASTPSIALELHVSLFVSEACGPDGIAFDGDDVLIWCALSRRVQRLQPSSPKEALHVPLEGPAVTRSRLTAPERAGQALFRAGNDSRISGRGALACTSCHPDGRTDGLSWRIGGHALQTPLLAGRVPGTAPYKWDGGDPHLDASLTGTMQRLGGIGLDKDALAALRAYVLALPAPRTPSTTRATVARGKALFESDTLGCDACHGGKRRTDRERHSFQGDLPNVDTPSLIGLAASAPYYHDGSAATLDALLRDTAKVHGMAELDGLDEREIADLVAYLESL